MTPGQGEAATEAPDSPSPRAQAGVAYRFDAGVTFIKQLAVNRLMARVLFVRDLSQKSGVRSCASRRAVRNSPEGDAAGSGWKTVGQS